MSLFNECLCLKPREVFIKRFKSDLIVTELLGWNELFGVVLMMFRATHTRLSAATHTVGCL